MKNYLNKIAYHLASNNEDKVNYFFNRQVEVNGPITADQMMFIIERRDDILHTWKVENMEFINAQLG